MTTGDATIDRTVRDRLLTREDPFLREISLTGVTVSVVKLLNVANTIDGEDDEEKRRKWYVGLSVRDLEENRLTSY